MAGLTFRLGQLPDALQTDASNNVGIGGSPSGTYKFEVTGISKFTSNVGIGSLNTSWQSTAYALQAGTTVALSAYGLSKNLYFDGTDYRALTTGYGSLIQSTSGGFSFYSTTTSVTALAVATLTSSLLTITNTGAATFSSSVSLGSGATSLLSLTGTSYGQITSPSTLYYDVDTQIFRNTAGTERMRITSAGNVGINTTTPLSKLTVWTPTTQSNAGVWSNCEIALHNSTSVGDYSQIGLGYAVGTTNAAAYIGLKSTDSTANGKGDLVFGTRDVTTDTAPTERMLISSKGNIGVGLNLGNTKLAIRGVDTTSSNYAFYSDNGVNNLLFVRNDGNINFGLAAVAPYNYSTSGRTAVLNSAGDLGYTSSTRESKSNIESITDISWVNQLRPVSFNYRIKDSLKNEFSDETYIDKSYGFIADEVEQINPDFVFYDFNEDGSKKLAGVKYESMTAILTKIVQEQQIQIQNLQEQINILAK